MGRHRRGEIVISDEWLSDNGYSFQKWFLQQPYAKQHAHVVTNFLYFREPNPRFSEETCVVVSTTLLKWLVTNVSKELSFDLPLGVTLSGKGFRARHGWRGETYCSKTVYCQLEAHRLWQAEKLRQYDGFIEEHLKDPRVCELLKMRKQLLSDEYTNKIVSTRV